MGLCVALTVPDTPVILDLLQAWPSFPKIWDGKSPIPEDRQWLTPIWKPKYHGSIGIEVVRYFCIEDLYGNEYPQSAEDQAFWKQFEANKVPLPASLTIGRFDGPKVPAHFATLLGEINVPFLKWVKHLATTAQADVSLYYEHERGDNPYEYADWEFNYQGDNTVQERIQVRDYEWNEISAEILWMQNGTILRSSRKLR